MSQNILSLGIGLIVGAVVGGAVTAVVMRAGVGAGAQHPPLSAASAAAVHGLPPPPAPVLPVPLSPEHAALLIPAPQQVATPRPEQLHQRFASEPVDAGWSPELESHLKRFIEGRQPAVEVDGLTVACRQTLCELLAFGRSSAAEAGWGQAIAEAGRQPWAASLAGSSTTSTTQHGRLVLATFLLRSRP